MDTTIHRITAINYFGGKGRYLDFLLPLFPEHINYLESFCGSAAAFLNKKPSPVETIADADKRLISFFRVLRDPVQSAELIRVLNLTLYSRDEFLLANTVSIDHIEDARRYFVRAIQSFAGQTDATKRQNSWRSTKQESRGGVSCEVSKFLNKVKGLYEVVERLKMAQIENRPFDYTIPAYDTKDTFHFEDPPYMHEVRTGKDDYKHEFSTADHAKLAAINNTVSGKVMVCCYLNDKMKKLYPADRWLMIPAPDRNANLSKTKLQREAVFCNYNAQVQGKLFE